MPWGSRNRRLRDPQGHYFFSKNALEGILILIFRELHPGALTYLHAGVGVKEQAAEQGEHLGEHLGALFTEQGEGDLHQPLVDVVLL